VAEENEKKKKCPPYTNHTSFRLYADIEEGEKPLRNERPLDET